MLTLPDEYNTLLNHFRPFFSKRVWKLAVVLLIGAVLTPGKRTVTSILRIMGLSREHHFQNYHRVLNRAVWSNLSLSAALFSLLLKTFLPIGTGLTKRLSDGVARKLGRKGFIVTRCVPAKAIL